MITEIAGALVLIAAAVMMVRKDATAVVPATA
jgi:hypothetical protein